MILVIYFKLILTSRYQIVIISKFVKPSLSFSLPSICVLHLRTSPSRLLFTLVHIYCECKWVSWKIMCNKILFQLNPKSCKKRNVFSFPRTEDEEADARDEVGWEWAKKKRWQRILRIIKPRWFPQPSFFAPLLPKFTFLLRFSFWLIISRRRCVLKEKSNYHPVVLHSTQLFSMLQCALSTRRKGETANEIVGEMNMFCGRSRVTSNSRVQEGFQLWSFLVMQISRRIRTGECFLNADLMWLKTPTTPTHVFSPYGTCCAWSKHISTISPADSRNWASIMKNFLLTSWKQREISTKVFLR